MPEPIDPTRPPRHLTRRQFVKETAFLGAGMASLGAGVVFPTGSRGLLDRLAVLVRLQERLPTRTIPSSGESLPVVGFGSTKAVLGIPDEGTEPVETVIRALLDGGGTVVDTSPRTPEIDRRFASVLQEPGLRDQLFVATKLHTRDEEKGMSQMRQNQRTVGRRRLDLVQVEDLWGIEHHWPHLLDWKASGEARYIGGTVFRNQDHARMEEFMRSESPDFVHVNYSVLEPASEERLLPLARDRGYAVLINRPFMNGEYFGRVQGHELPEWAADFGCRSWAQFSLKYVLSHPAVTCVLTETTNPEHMAENMEAALGPLPDESTRRRMREHVAQF